MASKIYLNLRTWMILGAVEGEGEGDDGGHLEDDNNNNNNNDNINIIIIIIIIIRFIITWRMISVTSWRASHTSYNDQGYQVVSR